MCYLNLCIVEKSGDRKTVQCFLQRSCSGLRAMRKRGDRLSRCLCV